MCIIQIGELVGQLSDELKNDSSASINSLRMSLKPSLRRNMSFDKGLQKSGFTHDLNPATVTDDHLLKVLIEANMMKVESALRGAAEEVAGSGNNTVQIVHPTSLMRGVLL